MTKLLNNAIEEKNSKKRSGSTPEKNNANGQLNSSQVNSLYKNSTFLDAFQVDEYYKHREVFLEQ